MRDLYALVLEETKRFRAALPQLLEEHAGAWVVFMNGRVASVHDDHDAAYRAGLAEYGPDATYVVDRVELKRAVPLTAGVLYG